MGTVQAFGIFFGLFQLYSTSSHLLLLCDWVLTATATGQQVRWEMETGLVNLPTTMQRTCLALTHMCMPFGFQMDWLELGTCNLGTTNNPGFHNSTRKSPCYNSKGQVDVSILPIQRELFFFLNCQTCKANFFLNHQALLIVCVRYNRVYRSFYCIYSHLDQFMIMVIS